MDLIDLGWNSIFADSFAQYINDGFQPGRVAREHKRQYLVLTEMGEVRAEISGKFRYLADSKGKFPTVGDWVAVTMRPSENRATIHAILPRQSAFMRKVAGLNTEEQVVAANFDNIFIVSSLDAGHNLRRIERYLTLAWESGAVPIILLNKCDLCDDPESRRAEVEVMAIGVSVHAISAADGSGFEALASHLLRGKTAAFLGSSGVGKSSIINRLLGEERLRVSTVSNWNDRGRHTTTHRELIILPAGGLVIDTPGMRELQVWGDEEGLRQTFEDIEELAARCKFRDCHHKNEPGCAVQTAIAEGCLDPGRYRSYIKLKKELAHLAAQQVLKASRLEKLKWKEISIIQRRLK